MSGALRSFEAWSGKKILIFFFLSGFALFDKAAP